MPDHSWVFVDEIQRMPNLLNEVYRFIEEKQLKFIFTGSSARKLKRADVNLLAVRALFRRIHPFMPMELRQNFDIEAVLRWGSIPLIWNSSDKRETLKATVISTSWKTPCCPFDFPHLKQNSIGLIRAWSGLPAIASVKHIPKREELY